MRKFYCELCLTSFFAEDPIPPVFCPECDTWESVVDKGEALPRWFEVAFKWRVKTYATHMAADLAKERGFTDYDGCCIHTIDKED